MTASTRRPLIVANWKAAPIQPEAPLIAGRLVAAARDLNLESVELIACPPYLWLPGVAEILRPAGIGVAAQAVAAFDHGSVTGEISAAMLRPLCDAVLIGHYERRILLRERDADVRKQLQAAIEAGLRPILCVGEAAEALEDNLGPTIVTEQLEAALEGLDVPQSLVIAYAPAWTTIGRVSPPGEEYANELCGIIREAVADITSPSLAAGARVIYGGRLSESTIAELAEQPEIDGALIGSGAINAERVATFARAFAR